jgi:hypothetical protein
MYMPAHHYFIRPLARLDGYKRYYTKYEPRGSV